MSYHNLEFLVRASAWDEVVEIFKDELGIDRRKQNASNREISGLFIIKLRLSDEELNDKFYADVLRSKNIAIISDPESDRIRDDILNEISKVETQLRKLLLHVSDIVENYHEYFAQTWAKERANNKDVIFENDLNPVTSYLGFEDIVTIFGLDKSSWDGKTLTANDLLDLLQDSSDVSDIKKKLAKNVQKNIVWAQISKHVLKTKVQWEDILPELNQLKIIRNKAAHFRVLTKKDLSDTKRLAGSILNKTEKKEYVSQKDIERLREATYPQFVEALMGARRAAESLVLFQNNAAATLAALQPHIGLANAVAHSAVNSTANLEALRKLLGHDIHRRPNNSIDDQEDGQRTMVGTKK